MISARFLLLVIALALCLEQAHAGELIELANVAEYAKPPRLAGYLARPDGRGPFPAVVVLHGCTGFSGHVVVAADQLKSWGYVALAVDSLGPRGLTDQCGQFFMGQATDAYAALKFLARQSFVELAKIAALGYSMGGSSVLTAVERGGIERQFTERFAAAIAYYPWCGGYWANLTAPTLILIGDADDMNSAQACRALAAQPRDETTRLDVVIYPGAYHAFDVRDLQSGKQINGHWFEYNGAAATDAENKVHAFLTTYFGNARP